MISRRWLIVTFIVLGYLPSIIDDDPVDADLLLGPQSGYAMEATLRLVTVLFFFLALREAMKDGSGSGRLGQVFLLATLAFLLSSWDEFIVFRLNVIDVLRRHYWYPTTVVMHGISLVSMYLAVRRARRTTQS